MTPDEPIPDLDIELSTETAEQLRAVAGLEAPPETFTDWAVGLWAQLGDADPALVSGDLFLDEPSRHAVHFGERVEHVPCVLDALIAAVLSDRDRVTVRSESPVAGAVVGVEVADGTVDVAPPGAVMSFGVSTDLPPPGAADEPPLAWFGDPDSPLRGLACDSINAFPTSAALEEWAADQEGVAAIELTFEQGLALARAGVGRLFA